MSRPELPHGYLGPQGKWQEWGLSTVSHNSPEIRTDSHDLNIDIKTSQSMKITANLIACSSGTEYKEFVFTQTKGDVVSLVLAIPADGYYKLQIYGLLSTDDSKTLPNIFNYLIYNTDDPKGAVTPFPKQFAQWKEGCCLVKPFHLDQDVVTFDVKIPGAKAVALTVDTEWFHLQKGGDGVTWQGEVKGLDALKARTKKASLNANYGPDETKYTSLLEYSL
ncbi:uncharacterized protein LOC143297815 [Babylonia areolata]|uniref:uncharacterized protein LOC143297804 n=1 Tax=Babylonia areolata TaxID=304850 RepID=UPI003FD3BF54